MNHKAFESLCEILDDAGVRYHLLAHPACRTSAESAQARALAGFPSTVGAKALLLKAEFDRGSEYCVTVIPGPGHLDSRSLKRHIPGLKKFRFATPEEMLNTCGVVPGAMPPFGGTVFPQISHLFIDDALRAVPFVGFNAAQLERSIVMRGEDYVRAAQPTEVFKLSDWDGKLVPGP